MTEVSLATIRLVTLSSGGRLKLLATAATFGALAALVSATNDKHSQNAGIDTAPLVLASRQPKRILPAGDYIVDDEIMPTVAALNESPAPPRAYAPQPETDTEDVTPLVTRLVKTISVSPEGQATTQTGQRPADASTSAPGAEIVAATPRSIAGVATPVAPRQTTTPVSTARKSPPDTSAPAETIIARSTAPAAAPRITTGAGYSIQLAATTNEEEARRLAGQLRARLSSNLGRYDLFVQPASVNDKSVFRIRVGALSKDDATLLCTKVRGSGGSCFVARD